MGNVKIPFGFNSINGTKFRTVKLKISIHRLQCGSSDDHQRRNSAVVVKFYERLKQLCLDAGVSFRFDDKYVSDPYVRIEGIFEGSSFYYQYKSIMADADVITARLESYYWDTQMRDIGESVESDASKFNWAHYES